MAVSEKTKRSLRTVVQAVIGVATAFPLLASASGLLEYSAGGATAAAVAGALARIMASEPVQPLLRWLGLAVPPRPEQ